MTDQQQDLADELKRRSDARDASWEEGAFKVGKDDEDDLAMDPPASEQQAKAMHAAAEGRSTLGIPKKVGQEFVGRAHDSVDWRIIAQNPSSHHIFDLVEALDLIRTTDSSANGATQARAKILANLKSRGFNSAQDEKPVGRWGGRAHKGA